ncbi:MAG TPA: hypothetical protein PLY41_07410 [Acetomicrobium sp.]|nr:hypothetical protein [Acetomicrobium sp.]
MTRLERLQNAGFDILWDAKDEDFYLEDRSYNLYISFYENNDGMPRVDIFYIPHPQSFNPDEFDAINGVPECSLSEEEFWERAEEGWLL